MHKRHRIVGGQLVVAMLISVAVIGCSSCATDKNERSVVTQEVSATRPAATQRLPAIKRSAHSHNIENTPHAGLQGPIAIKSACTGTSTKPAVLCVAPTGKGSTNGTTERPFLTIQQAVAIANTGDTIYVARGEYRENVRIAEKSLRVLGGFCAGFKTRHPSRCVSNIEGHGNDAVVNIIDAADTVIDGFRITGGTGNSAQKAYYYLGGGVYSSDSSPTIAHCLIEHNDIITTHPNPESVGGAIFAEEGNPKILFNVVRHNRSGRGAVGIWAKNSALIKGNDIHDNISVGDHGGGIYASGPNLRIERNRVTKNRVPLPDGSWGGGILVYGRETNAELTGNVVSGNLATDVGSGTMIGDGATAVLRNELIYGNHCPARGGSGLYVEGDTGAGSTATVLFTTIAAHHCTRPGNAIYVEELTHVVVDSSIIWDNGGDDFYTDRTSSLRVAFSLTQEPMRGDGNFSQDPLFADPHRDFHLRSQTGRWDTTAKHGQGSWINDANTSPAIDRANPRFGSGNESVPHGNRCNIGAFGNTTQASHSDYTNATPSFTPHTE